MSRLLFKTKHLIKNAKDIGPVKQYRKKAYDKKFESNRDLNLFRGVFSSFKAADQAANACPKSGSYDNQDSAKMYKTMAAKLFPHDYPNLFWLENKREEINTVYDFGGHFGMKYYAYKKYLKKHETLNWFVHDMPAVMDEGEKHAKDQNVDAHLKFCRDRSNINRSDFFMALGSLQYIDLTMKDLFANLQKKPKYVLITIPCSAKPTYYTVNSIGTANCAYIIRNRDQFIEEMNSLGYELTDAWDIPNKKMEIPFHEEYSLHQYNGHFFTLK